MRKFLKNFPILLFVFLFTSGGGNKRGIESIHINFIGTDDIYILNIPHVNILFIFMIKKMIL